MMGGLWSRWAETWSIHSKKPGGGFGGWMVTIFLKHRNLSPVTNAVEICDIQPDNTVLEVGFGPGLGLEMAYEKVKGGNGSLHGVDHSERMYDMARKRLGLDTAEKHADKFNKIDVHLCSVTNMPFEDEKFDRVFHVNCFYYWPDMDAAVKELYRVMKPGALIVTTMNNEKLQRRKEIGVIRYGDIDNSRQIHELIGKKWIRKRVEEKIIQHGQ